MMSATASLYEPLQLQQQRNEIHLLKILPSHKLEALLLCQLILTSLDDERIFDALSWCWGQSLETKVIVVNEEQLQCSPNLEVALRHFRGTSSTVTW